MKYKVASVIKFGQSIVRNGERVAVQMTNCVFEPKNEGDIHNISVQMTGECEFEVGQEVTITIE